MKRIVYSMAVACLAASISSEASAQRNENPYENVESVVTVSEDNLYDPSTDTREEMLYYDGYISPNFSSYVAKLPAIDGPERLDHNSYKDTPIRVDANLYNRYFDIQNELDEDILVEPKEPNAELYLLGKLDGTADDVHALVFYAKDGNIYQYIKVITFDRYGNPIDHQNIQYTITAGHNGTQQMREMVCNLNEENFLNCVVYEEKNDAMVADKSEGKIFKVANDGNIEKVFHTELSD